MSKIYYKATQMDGQSFHGNPKVSYVNGDGSLRSDVVRPAPFVGRAAICGPGVLHASDVPTETLIGCSWPCRLFEVEPVGKLVDQEGHKYAFARLRVVREIEAHRVFGPQGEYVVALIEAAKGLTAEQVDRLYAARNTAWDAAWNTAWDAAGYAARDAARNTAGALVVRDLIGQHRFTQEHYDTLTRPWRTAVGPIHPEDAPL